MTRLGKVMLVTILALVLLGAALLYAGAINFTKVDRAERPLAEDATAASGERATYNGYLRVYIVEPVSRYLDYEGRQYQYGFLGFAVNQAISVNDGQIYSDTVIWTAGSFAPLSDHNIMAVGVVLESTGHTAYSNPPSGYPFTAHYVDATAASTPGVRDTDEPTAPYTHTVFVEEATQTGCSFCPLARQALESLYNSGTYQFHYVAMVANNAQAYNFLDTEYNFYGTPTTYYDGGASVVVGGYPSQYWHYYSDPIVTNSTRSVNPVKLAIKLNYISTTQISVEYVVKTSNQAPPAPSTPTGPLFVRVGESVQFGTVADDPDGDAMEYRWSFDKDDTTAWTEPYTPGTPCLGYSSWDSPGVYSVSAQARDYWDESASWSGELQVVVYRCGDPDGNGIVTISDAVFMISYIFGGGTAPDPTESGDADCNGILTISDAVYLITYIFGGGPAPCASCA